MDHKTIKKEFIELQKEELNYIDNISRTSLNKSLSKPEKLELRRNLEEFETRSYEMFQILRESSTQIKSIDAYEVYENLFDSLRDEEIDFMEKNAKISIKSNTVNIVFNEGIEEIDYTLFTKIVRSGAVQITIPPSLKSLSNSNGVSLDKIDEKVFDYFEFIKRERKVDVYGDTIIYKYYFSDYQRPKIIFENFRNSLFLKEDKNLYDLLITMYYFDSFYIFRHYMSSKFQDDVRPWPTSSYIDDYGDTCWKYDYNITIIKAFTICFMERDGSYRQYVNDGIIKDGFILYELDDVEKIKEYIGNRIDSKKKDSSKSSAKKLVMDNKPGPFSGMVSRYPKGL